MQPKIEGGIARTVRVRPRIRLFCFAHAGGTAQNYKDWGALLPEWVEPCAVELPAHGLRLNEPPIGTMSELVEEILPRVQPLLDIPYALFGHSVGGKIAFEVAQAATSQGAPSASHLFVATSNAPHFPKRPRVHDLPYDDFIEELHVHGGTPREVLADRELMEVFLPALRADFAVSDLYQAKPGAHVTCALTAIVGVHDPVTSAEGMTAWQEYTRGNFRLAKIDGDHFIVTNKKNQVVREIAKDLEAQS